MNGEYTPSTQPSLKPFPTPEPDKPARTVLGPAIAGAGVAGLGAYMIARTNSSRALIGAQAVSVMGLGGGKLAGALVGAGLLGGALVGGGLALAHRGHDHTPDSLTDHDGDKGQSTTPPAPDQPLSKERPFNAYEARKGDQLPDIKPIAPEELVLQERDGKRFLRFSSTWRNVGEAPMELNFNSKTLDGVKQRVYNSDGTKRDVESHASFISDKRDDHRHTHLNDFARYQLFEANEDGIAKKEVRKNDKVSFFITDTETPYPGMDPDNLGKVDKRGGGGRITQGISVGNADTYGAGLSGQDFDVSNLKPGKYILRQTFDPADRLAETNEKNNSYDVLVDIKKDGNVELDPVALRYPRTESPRGLDVRADDWNRKKKD